MADDRVYIKCKHCGGWKMLLKHYAGQGPMTWDNGILEWLDTHAYCHPNWGEHSLDDPGFELLTETEKDVERLDPSKQNMEGSEINWSRINNC